MAERQALAGRENLQIMFMTRLCKFQKQNRELLYAKCVGQAGDVIHNLPDD